MPNPSWMLPKPLQLWLLWESYNQYQLWVGLSSKWLPQFGERDKVVFAMNSLVWFQTGLEEKDTWMFLQLGV